MTNKTDTLTESLGLLASGSCRAWHIDLDESLDGKHWYLELDGPNSYLVLQLKNLQVIPAALTFFQSGLRRSQLKIPAGPEKGDRELCLGKFGAASVSLLWDDEEGLRCYLVIGSRAHATLRLTLFMEDIEMLIDALGQATNDLSEEFGLEGPKSVPSDTAPP